MSHQAETPHLERTSRLGEIAEVAAGQPAPDERSAFSVVGHPFLRAGSLEGLLAGQSELEFQRIGPVTAKTLGLRLFPSGTVIFAKSGISATLGRIYRLRVPCYLTSHLAAVMPGELIDGGYLFHWLGHNSPSDLIPNQAYPSIRLGDIKRVKITLPLLAEQKRIAAILDKADEIRRKQREMQKLATEFERSLFLEMFGDPARNPKGWPIGTIRDLAADVRYGSSEKTEAAGQFPMLRMNNITQDGGLSFDSIKYVSSLEQADSKYLLRNGDVLFNRTNSPDLVGKTAVYRGPTPMLFAGYLIRIRTNGSATPEFVSGYLNSRHGKMTLRKVCKPIIGMANINAQEMLNIPIIIPPMKLQTQYSGVISKYRDNATWHEDRMKLFDQLYESLISIIFGGNLDISGEPL